jgi:hypothetical protein
MRYILLALGALSVLACLMFLAILTALQPLFVALSGLRP